MSNVIRTYNEASNVAILRRLPSRLRVVFALLCAFRLLPTYQRFHSRTGLGDPEALDTLVESLWVDCIDKTLEDEGVRKYSEQCLDLVPNEDKGWDEETQPYAEDAAAAVVYAYRSRLTGDPQEAAWAARRIYESLDRYVQTVMEISLHDPETERAILSHPAMQAELARQERDLDDLVRLAKLEDDVVTSLRELRGRSECEAPMIFAATGAE